MAFLRDQSSGKEWPLRRKIIMIGRDPSCDLVVPNERTSSRHALIIQTARGYAIEDLESGNGTFVNGRPVNGRTLIRALDRVEISGLTAVFHDGGADSAFPPTRQGLPQVATAAASALTETPGAPAPILASMEMSAGVRTQVRAEAKLKAVLEIARVLSDWSQQEDALPRILDALIGIFPQADRGFILLRDADTGQLVNRAARVLPPLEQTQPAISQSILDHVMATGCAVLSADAGRDDRFHPGAQSIEEHAIGSILCAPLLGRAGARLGVIQIDARGRHQVFVEEDLEVLICATTQAARALELRELQREQNDLNEAQRIQKSFLPARRPEIDALAFFDYYAAARRIGGDYFDYIPLPGNRLAIAIGDVSGKGAPAALLMAQLSAATRFFLATESTTAQAVNRLNTALNLPETSRFITFLVIVLDLNDFSLTVVNAGHALPLRRIKDGRVDLMGATEAGLPLGVFDEAYRELSLTLDAGDTLVLYTDGITEARNPGGDFYGTDRVLGLVERAPGDAPELLGQAILDDVHQFAANRPQGDDITLVCFSRRL